MCDSLGRCYSSWASLASNTALKILLPFSIIAIRCADSSSSSVTGLRSGTYFTTLDLQCKKGESFNSDYPTAIPEVLSEEFRGNINVFRGGLCQQ